MYRLSWIPVICFILTMMLRSHCAAGDEPALAEESEPAMSAHQAAEEQQQLVERILQKTKAARDKLTEKNTSAPTVEAQQAVVDDLEALVDSLKKHAQSSQSPSHSPSAERQSSSTSKSNAHTEKSKSNPAKAGSSQNQSLPNPQDSTERSGESPLTKALAERKRRLEHDIWGHLPPAIREQLLNTYGERMLPEYESHIRKFYETLSEPRRK